MNKILILIIIGLAGFSLKSQAYFSDLSSWIPIDSQNFQEIGYLGRSSAQLIL
jgi:hypothetical protein